MFIYWLIWTQAYHYTGLQAAEFLVYTVLAVGIPCLPILVLVKRREWRENQRRYPAVTDSPRIATSPSNPGGRSVPCSLRIATSMPAG